MNVSLYEILLCKIYAIPFQYLQRNFYKATFRYGGYKVLKHLKETGSALPKVSSTPSRKVRSPKLFKNTTPERRSEEIFEEACENWLLLLV